MGLYRRSRLAELDVGPGAEGRQIRYAANQRGQGFGHRDIRRRRIVFFAVRGVIVHGQAESGFELFGGSRGHDSVLAAPHAEKNQPLLFEPLPDRGKIGVSNAKAGRELLRRKPLVIFGRTGRLLRRDHCLEHGSRGKFARIVRRFGHGRVRSRERDAQGIVDLLCEAGARLLSRQGQAREKRKQNRACGDKDGRTKKLGTHGPFDLQERSGKPARLWLAIVGWAKQLRKVVRESRDLMILYTCTLSLTKLARIHWSKRENSTSQGPSLDCRSECLATASMSLYFAPRLWRYSYADPNSGWSATMRAADLARNLLIFV